MKPPRSSPFDDAGRLVSTANEHLARLNGDAILADAGCQAVRLGNRFVREGGPTHVHLVGHDEARARDSLTVVAPVTAETRATAFVVASVVVDGVPVAPPPPDGLRHLARATTDKNADDLLALIGNAESLGWDELYRRTRSSATPWAAARGASSTAAGPRSSNSAGSPARRTTPMRAAPEPGTRASQVERRANAMTLGEGQQFIRDLARRWLDSLP
ncbi:MAG: hypothetical protein LC808_23060 [Actinobacteria bacterium]|nr:hypothetical protein [Actinomycetota bacterium]